MKGRKGQPVEAPSGTAPAACPRPPVWMTMEAKAEWKRAAPELFGRKLLAPDTMATLESYCVAVGQVRECETIMQAEGRFVSTDSGRKAHPAFRVQASAMREARLLAAELGLTPHRRGLKGDGDDEEKGDGWDSDLLP